VPLAILVLMAGLKPYASAIAQLKRQEAGA